jgi:hypothetical protein
MEMLPMRPDGSFNRLHAKAAELKAIRKPERIIDRRGETATDPLGPPDLEPLAPPPSPPAPIDRTGMSPAEKLEANLSTALYCQAQVMAMGVDPDNLKRSRLVAETAASTVNAALKAQEAVLRHKREDEIMPRILAALAEEKAKLAAAGYEPPPVEPKQHALMLARLPHLFGIEAAAKALAELSEEDRAEVIAEVERRR